MSVGARLQRAEVEQRVFQFPESGRRHAADGHRRRDDGARDDLARVGVVRAEVDRAVVVDAVPVQGAVGELVTGQGELVEGSGADPAGDRKRVLHPILLPRLVARVRLAEQRRGPHQPVGTGLANFGAVARPDRRRIESRHISERERGAQPAAVQCAPGHQSRVRAGRRVEVCIVCMRKHRVGGAESRRVVARGGLRRQDPQEVPAGVDGESELVAVDRLTFDKRREW